MVCREATRFTSQWQDNVDFFALLQGEHVHNWAATRSTRALRHFPYLEPIQTATVGEAQDVVMGVGHKQLIDPVIFLGGCSLFAAPAALLCSVLAQWLAFDVTTVAHGHHHIGGGDQIFGGQVVGAVLYQAAASA